MKRKHAQLSSGGLTLSKKKNNNSPGSPQATRLTCTSSLIRAKILAGGSEIPSKTLAIPFLPQIPSGIDEQSNYRSCFLL
jgi:hypothetical protein